MRNVFERHNAVGTFDVKKAIDILEKFLKRSPANIKVMNQLADLYWLIGDSKKAIDLKYKIYKHYVYAGNRFLADKTKIGTLTSESKNEQDLTKKELEFANIYSNTYYFIELNASMPTSLNARCVSRWRLMRDSA